MRLFLARMESRAFVKCLIALNISFFLYQLYSFTYFNNNQNPCVVVMNNTSSSYFTPEKLKVRMLLNFTFIFTDNFINRFLSENSFAVYFE